MSPSLVAFLYAVSWVPLFLFRVEALRAALPYYSRRERIAVRLAPCLLSLHVAFACVWLNFADIVTDRHLLAGAALWGAGLGLWFWGRIGIGPPAQRRLPDEPPLVFRQDGPFGIVRHPLYASYLFLALAPVLVTASVALLPTFAACVAVIAVRAAQEESRLRAQLGASYDDYCRGVKRLIPFLW